MSSADGLQEHAGADDDQHSVSDSCARPSEACWTRPHVGLTLETLHVDCMHAIHYIHVATQPPADTGFSRWGVHMHTRLHAYVLACTHDTCTFPSTKVHISVDWARVCACAYELMK